MKKKEAEKAYDLKKLYFYVIDKIKANFELKRNKPEGYVEFDQDKKTLIIKSQPLPSTEYESTIILKIALELNGNLSIADLRESKVPREFEPGNLSAVHEKIDSAVETMTPQ